METRAALLVVETPVGFAAKVIPLPPVAAASRRAPEVYPLTSLFCVSVVRQTPPGRKIGVAQPTAKNARVVSSKSVAEKPTRLIDRLTFAILSYPYAIFDVVTKQIAPSTKTKIATEQVSAFSGVTRRTFVGAEQDVVSLYQDARSAFADAGLAGVQRCRRDAQGLLLFCNKGDVRPILLVVNAVVVSSKGVSSGSYPALQARVVSSVLKHTGADLRCEDAERFVGVVPLLSRRRPVITLQPAAALAGRACEVIGSEQPEPERQVKKWSNRLGRVAFCSVRRSNRVAVVRVSERRIG